MTSQVVKLACPKSELHLNITLQCGQSFRWREVSAGVWRGVLAGRVWTLWQDDTHISHHTHCHPPPTPGTKTNSAQPKRKRKKPSSDVEIEKEIEENHEKCKNVQLDHQEANSVLRDYFQLDFSLKKMYAGWSKADPNFAAVCEQFPGVRMLNQDPVENVFSFICSSNNNIQRISSMVERMSQLYGTPVATVDGSTWYSFPEVSALAAPGVEETLRKEGFGYRAKYIYNSARMIMDKGGADWLHSLKTLPYEECRSELMLLSGVGPKVSDCICLMSMGHLGAIPVDTHVFQIAARDYLPRLKGCKSVTEKVYLEIGNHFRELFGTQAGWAHSVLFSADLKKFEPLKEKKSQANKKVKKS